jgi:radical SAM protein with 4Fe4S-binding SPASM domain
MVVTSRFQLSSATRYASVGGEWFLWNLESGSWLRLSGAGRTALDSLLSGLGSAADRRAFETRLLRQGFLVSQVRGPASQSGDVSPESPESAAPAACILNLTDRCNLGCHHCAVFGQARLVPGTRWRRKPDAPVPRLTRIMDRIADGGVRHVALFGGEPLLRRDAETILRLARERYVRVGLATNGTLITDATAQLMAELGTEVLVSLDGSCADVHDRLRGAGTFAKTVEGLGRLQRAGCRGVRIATTITRQNARDVPNMVRLARRLGVGLQLSAFLPLGRGHHAQADLGLEKEDLLRALKCTWILAEYYEVPSASFNARCETWLARALDRCSGGKSAVLVDGAGDVYPCASLRSREHRLGNVLREGLPVRARHACSATVDEIPECARCEVRYFCGGGCAAERRGGSSRVMCALFRDLLPTIVARWRRERSSWANLKAVFGADVEFAAVREYLTR